VVHQIAEVRLVIGLKVPRLYDLIASRIRNIQRRGVFILPMVPPAAWLSSSYDETNVALQNINIHAALFALNKSYEFEKYNSGKFGTITIVGSICQNRRGAVGTSDPWTGQSVSGYSNKDYTHDRRMSYDTPPHFLEPTNAGWEIVSWKRVTP
jgi:hypothetical protein